MYAENRKRQNIKNKFPLSSAEDKPLQLQPHAYAELTENDPIARRSLSNIIILLHLWIDRQRYQSQLAEGCTTRYCYRQKIQQRKYLCRAKNYFQATHRIKCTRLLGWKLYARRYRRLTLKDEKYLLTKHTMQTAWAPIRDKIDFVNTWLSVGLSKF